MPSRFSGESVLRFGDYEVLGNMGVTYVDGEPGALLRLQRSSARFFQRPDVSYVQVDPTRRQLSGAKGGISIERQNARHWLWEAATSFTTPEFETNDIGRLARADGVLVASELQYQQTTPGRWFRSYDISLGQNHEWNYRRRHPGIGARIGAWLHAAELLGGGADRKL